METRANYIAVGIFTLAAIAATFVLVYWVGRLGDDRDLVPVDIRIQGSVSGLGAGSIVQFNGITVGRVQGLSLDNKDPRYVIVHASVNKATPLRQDTRATIGIRGLSGGAFVQLEGGTPLGASLLGGARAPGDVPSINGDPSVLSDLLVRINGIALRTERVMDTLDGFVTKNAQTVSQTFDNAEKFSEALAANSDGVAKFMNSAGDVAKSLEQLSAKLDGSLAQAEKILSAVDPESINRTVKNAEAFSETLAGEREQIAALVTSVNRTATQLGGFVENMNSTLAKVDGVVAAIPSDRITSAIDNIDRSAARASSLLAVIDADKLKSTVDDIASSTASTRKMLEGIDQNAVRELVNNLGSASKEISQLVAALDSGKINSAVDNIASAAEGAQSIVDDVSKVTQPLGKRADDIDQIVSDASQLAARLNDTSVKVDNIVSRFDSMIGAGAGDGLVADARKTLDQFRETARNFNTQISSIAGDINSFTKRGLGDTQNLIRDARQSLNGIDRVMRNLQDNPSSLITGSGGAGVRESSGSRVRR